MNTQYLLFNGEINEKSTNALTSAITDAMNDTAIDDIYVAFCSNGGQVNYGVGAHHFLKASPKPITIHGIGPINSIALCVFMGVPKRYATSATTFQFHGVGRWLNQGNYTSPILRDHLSLITGDETALAGIWKGHMKIDDSEAASFFQGEHVHNCEWAISKGLIEDVRDFFIPASGIGRIRNVVW